MPRPTLCLNMIVKNESARIIRALESVAPYIASWVIVDTGSTDGTPDIITKFFGEKKIPGLMGSCEFVNFSHARNVALQAVRAAPFEFDYALLMDADMQLRVKDDTWLDDVKGPSFDMYQTAGPLVYQNRRLVSKVSTGVYNGVTHEYLDVDSAGCIAVAKADFLDHADGSNRPEKYKRDIKLLKDGLKDEPNNYRYFYYLAQSYRDAGKHDKAAKWYKKRVDAGGWDEERWSAQCNYAHCLRDMGDEAGFIRETLIAYNMRPSRAETVFDLAKFYREKGDNATSVIFSEAGMKIPHSNDGLFVNDYVYECGCKDEFAICAFYLPNRATEGYIVCNEMSLKKSPYPMSREMARNNLFFYHPPLSTLCPSFKWQTLDVKAPEGFIATNPSVFMKDDRLGAIVRTVNYKIDDFGRYMIRGTDGTANDSNPINTRSLLVDLDADLRVINQGELILPVNWPEPQFKAVIGLEDMRAFVRNGDVCASATIRENTPEGWCTQCVVRVVCGQYPDSTYRLTDFQTLDGPMTGGRLHEKNWMPIVEADFPVRWMYRCGEVINSDQYMLFKNECEWDIGQLGGGSQVLPYGNGYIALVHEARTIPGKQTRFYMHRFVSFDDKFKVTKITPPFYFNEKGIEYAMGLAWHPDNKAELGKEDLVISYGFKDAEARIATVSSSDIHRLLTL